MRGKRLIIYTDGAAEPNPGPAGIGIVIVDEWGRVIAEISKAIGRKTNNQAEYEALIVGLETAAGLDVEDIEVRADSQLLVRQLTGQYRVRKPGLKPLYEKVHQLLEKFHSFKIVHIPREENRAADALSHRALSGHC